MAEAVPPPPKKIIGKKFSGKFGHFVNPVKFGNLVIFQANIK